MDVPDAAPLHQEEDPTDDAAVPEVPHRRPLEVDGGTAAQADLRHRCSERGGWAGAKLKELFNSNEKKYGGSGDFISKKVKVEAEAWNGREHSITLDLAPLAVMVFSLK